MPPMAAAGPSGWLRGLAARRGWCLLLLVARRCSWPPVAAPPEGLAGGPRRFAAQAPDNPKRYYLRPTLLSIDA